MHYDKKFFKTYFQIKISIYLFSVCWVPTICQPKDQELELHRYIRFLDYSHMNYFLFHTLRIFAYKIKALLSELQ